MNLINKKVCRGIGILILLTLYLGLCFEAAALEEMAVGDFHELEGGYGIKVEGADVESGKASFLLLKEDRVVDEKHVNNGERFRLHDEEIFYFEATLDSVFRSEEMIMVHLVDYNREWVEPPYEEPQEWVEPVEPPNGEPPYAILYSLLIVSAAAIVLIFVVFKIIGWKDRKRQQKIKEYRAKLEEWEKEGYDVSGLKEVLEGKKVRESDLKRIKSEFEDFEKDIKTLKRLKVELDSLDTKGFESEVEVIKSKLKSPDKIHEIEKEIAELKDKIPDGRVPDLSVNRSPSKTSITAGEELDVKIELKNEGKEVAKFVSFSDSFPESFKIISGDNFWTGDLKPGESMILTYTLKADKAGKYTIPRLIVKYEDKRQKKYEQSAEAIEIEVKGVTREKHIFKLEIESPDTIEIASDEADQGVYSVRFITPHYSSRPKSTDVGKDLLEYINASIDAVTVAMNRVRGVRGDEEEKIEEYSREMLGSLRDLGCILYKQILPPDIIGELSEHQQIKHLQLSISEDLGVYPWEAMHDDADIDSFLCLNYALGRSIQVEGTLECPTGIIGDKLKALVIGDPLEGCERELPMAKKEAEVVAKKLRERGVEVKTLIGKSATLPKVLPELGRGYDIIHYAGHAEFDTEKPRDSYLILRDEMHLKAKNITKQFEGKKKPIFAYINACKAGKRAAHEEKVEDIEYTNDVSGLASAFLEKGIYYIGSVWPIHDDASADAAIYFYDNFLKGVSIGESLRRAKVEVYEKYKGKRTAWAGLVLYGNPTLTIVSE